MNPRSWPVLLLALPIVGCGSPVPAPDPAYQKEIEGWQTERVRKLRAEDGWLALVGLHWLAEGDNRFGSDPGNAVPLVADGVPGLAGILALHGTTVHLVPAEGVDLTVNGEPAALRVLRDDALGQPDLLKLGRLSFHLVRRGERVGVRVKDPEAETRTRFRGLEYYPTDPSYRVEARLERYPEPRKVEIPTVLGTTDERESPGRLAFDLGGRALSLEPLLEGDDPGTLFIIFQDETSGRETYGAGRYLYATLEGERAILDFNRAYNPPCAFTPFATCPLPPRGNRLATAVRAGEKSYGGH